MEAYLGVLLDWRNMSQDIGCCNMGLEGLYFICQYLGMRLLNRALFLMSEEENWNMNTKFKIYNS